MSRTPILGVGLTAFGRRPDATTLSLMSEAAQAALDDAGLERGDIDGLITGYSTTHPHLMMSTLFAEYFGLSPTYAHGVQVGGATGLAMADLARHLVTAGAVKRVLVVAGENRLSGQTRTQTIATLAQVGDPVHEVPNGGSVPAYYALLASAYLHRTGRTEEDLAQFAVLMRRHAIRYPGAHLTKPIEVPDVMGSRSIASPLKLMDCCPISDGAAAFVIGEPLDGRPDRGLAIIGGGQSHTHQHVTAAPTPVALGASLSAARAFDEAGCVPGDMQALGIYDSFTNTLAELLEAVGFCASGASVIDARDGRFDVDGPLPLNPHGGLLSYGHCGAAGGMAHLVAIARLMTDNASKERTPALGFVHADGGVLSSHVSIVLERRS